MGAAGAELIGRAAELAKLRSMITNARNGLSGALIVRGEPGIGKTALIEAAAAMPTDFTVIRTDGYEAETAIPFAGLHRIGVALRAFSDGVSARHRHALAVAWGMEEGPAPDRFLVGMATLALFESAAAGTPLVCLIDDAQWLDAESLAVLGFVARRLTAESTVLLFATREFDDVDVALAGVDTLALSGLDGAAAVQLLREALPEGIDPFAATQIAAATGGNPLALIDLARDMTLRQITDITLSANPVPVSRQLEAHYLERVRDLTEDEQQWLLIAAIETSEHLELIEGAARRLGLGRDSSFAAVRAGLVSLADGVSFRHPLVRSAVFSAAGAAQRRDVHTALADEADARGLVEVRAWHAAEAAPESDLAVADQLADAAERAARRGGLVSQARLLARAAHLTPPGSLRDDRLIEAAEIAVATGAAHLSGELLDRIDAAHVDSIQRGRILMARARLAVFIADPVAVVEAPARLLDAAALLADVPALQQKALLQAFEVVLFTQRQMRGVTMDDLAQAFAAAPHVGDDCSAAILNALWALIALPYAEAVPHIRAGFDALLELDDTRLAEFGFVGISLTSALFDFPSGFRYLDRLVDIARESSSLRALDVALWIRALFETERGDMVAAKLHIDQVRELRRAIGYDAENVVNVAYLAWTGSPRADVEAIGDLTRSMGFGAVYTSAQGALANQELADGDYRTAFDRLGKLLAEPFLTHGYLHYAPYVEAAVRSGHHDEARCAAEVLESMAQVNDSSWLHGLNVRCRALLATDAEAEDHYRHAVELLDESVVPMEAGRAHLLYGEWLRRIKRRRDAREHLEAAMRIFERINAPAFARRARDELAATGAKVADRTRVAGVELPEREATVAALAASGATNAEIAATLFISVNTVDYHLRKVFQRLGVTSRRQLADRFAAPD